MDIRKAWENARDAAQLEDFRFHDLRHSTASYLAMKGASLVEIAEVLGHRTLPVWAPVGKPRQGAGGKPGRGYFRG